MIIKESESIFNSKRLEGGNSYDGYFIAQDGDYKGKKSWGLMLQERISAF